MSAIIAFLLFVLFILLFILIFWFILRYEKDLVSQSPTECVVGCHCNMTIIEQIRNSSLTVIAFRKF